MATEHERRITKVELLGGDVMTAVWADTRSQERQAQALREIATRLLGESDPQKLRALVAELAIILKHQLRTTPPN